LTVTSSANQPQEIPAPTKAATQVLSQARSSDAPVRTRWLDLPSTVRWASFVAVALLVLVLRRPETLTKAAFFYEDGQVFYVGAYFGTFLDQLTRAYAGYLVVIPRLAAALEWTVPVPYAPLVGNLIALAAVALLAAFIASDRLSNVFPDRWMRILLAALLVLLPGSWETLGSITLIQWYVAIYLVLVAIAMPPTRRSFKAIEGIVVGCAGLTGPFSILFAPLFWARALILRDRWSATLAAIVSLCGAVQIALLTASGERSAALPDPAVMVAALTARLWATMIGGHWMSGALSIGLDPRLVAAATIALVGALIVVWAKTPRVPRFAFGYAAAVIVGSTILDQPRGFPDSPYLAGRYFLLPAFCVAIAVAVLLADSQRRAPLTRIAVLAVSGLFLVGIVGDARLPAHPDYGWADRSACIGGPDPCQVPVEFPNAWTIHWPGSGGTYSQPGTEGIREEP
jgi:hypothetical protein